MDVAKTPMGTQIVLKAEKPGMVIGKGGKNIRKVTSELEERFDLDDPQIDVQEVDEPDLNAQIVADRLANALERGWYFRKAGHTTIDRIMDAGALGAEIVLSGKVTGARSRVEKFNRGYIKHNGEPAEEIVDRGTGVAVMKLGTIGVQVRIIPPNAELPDDFEVYEDADVEEFIEEPSGDVDELLADADAAMAGEGEGDVDAEEVSEAAEEFEEVPEPEFDDEEVIEEPDVAEEAGETAAEDGDDVDELDAVDEAIESEVDADADAEAGDLMDEMEDSDETDEAEEADSEATESDADADVDADVDEADADEEVDEE
jgi:small subunit ribosomal protein S3